MAERPVSKSGATASFITGLVSLWPILFFVVLWALAQWGGEGDFSLAPRDTTRNIVLVVIGLGGALAAAVVAIVFAVAALRRGRAGRRRAIVGLVTGIIGAVVVIAIFALILWVKSMLPSHREGELTAVQRVEKCRENQRNVATALGPEMWGFDHPDEKPEELKELDLSPRGDLVEPDDGVPYIDPSFLDCPADDDEDDVDYAVDITPEGVIRVRCIDPAGVEEGHNP